MGLLIGLIGVTYIGGAITSFFLLIKWNKNRERCLNYTLSWPKKNGSIAHNIPTILWCSLIWPLSMILILMEGGGDTYLAYQKDDTDDE